MQILHERIEFCWTHLAGIGALENSLWGFDGNTMRIWLYALAIESSPKTPIVGDEEVDDDGDAFRGIKESVTLPLMFYPVGE